MQNDPKITQDFVNAVRDTAAAYGLDIAIAVGFEDDDGETYHNASGATEQKVGRVSFLTDRLKGGYVMDVHMSEKKRDENG